MKFSKRIMLLIPLLLFPFVGCGGSEMSSSPKTTPYAQETQSKIKALQEQNQTLIKQIDSIQASIQMLDQNIATLNTRLKNLEAGSPPSRKQARLPSPPRKVTAKKAKAVRKAHHSKSSKKSIHTTLTQSTKHAGVPPLRLYHLGASKYKNHKFLEAANIFLKFVKTFPHHPYANNALYWAGESYYSLGNYEKAAFYFKAVIEKYPKGNKVPDALLKLGYTYAKLGKKKVAREYLFQLMDEYPFSEPAQKAQAKLDELY